VPGCALLFCSYFLPIIPSLFVYFQLLARIRLDALNTHKQIDALKERFHIIR